MFNVCDKKLNNIHNIRLIHPRKQRIVGLILNKIPRISVFGSSTRWDCNETSDIDILLDINKINCNKSEAYKYIRDIVKSDFDLLWLDEIKDNLNKQQYKNIIERSVDLYADK